MEVNVKRFLYRGLLKSALIIVFDKTRGYIILCRSKQSCHVVA